MTRYLRSFDPPHPRGFGVLASNPWRTADGVEIWRALALYQPCVEVLEAQTPMRVVLLQDYEALAQELADTVRRLKNAQDLCVTTAPSAGAVPTLTAAIA